MGDWKKCIAFMAKYVPLWVIISAGIAYMWPHLFRDYKVVNSYGIYMYALGRDRLR